MWRKNVFLGLWQPESFQSSFSETLLSPVTASSHSFWVVASLRLATGKASSLQQQVVSLIALSSSIVVWNKTIMVGVHSWSSKTPHCEIAQYLVHISHCKSSLAPLLHTFQWLVQCSHSFCLQCWPQLQICSSTTLSQPPKDPTTTGMNLMDSQYNNSNCCYIITVQKFVICTWYSSALCWHWHPWELLDTAPSSCPVQKQINARSISKAR